MHFASGAHQEGFVKFGNLFGDGDHTRVTECGDNFVGELIDAVATFVECERVVKVAVLG